MTAAELAARLTDAQALMLTRAAYFPPLDGSDPRWVVRSGTDMRGNARTMRRLVDAGLAEDMRGYGPPSNRTALAEARLTDLGVEVRELVTCRHCRGALRVRAERSGRYRYEATGTPDTATLGSGSECPRSERGHEPIGAGPG